MKNNSGVYRIVNLVTGQCYVGSTKHPKDRKSTHYRQLREGAHPDTLLQNDYNKYGEACFYFEVVLLCEPFELRRYEHLCINGLFDAYYNTLKVVARDRKYRCKINKFRRKTMTPALELAFDKQWDLWVKIAHGEVVD